MLCGSGSLFAQVALFIFALGGLPDVGNVLCILLRKHLDFSAMSCISAGGFPLSRAMVIWNF